MTATAYFADNTRGGHVDISVSEGKSVFKFVMVGLLASLSLALGGCQSTQQAVGSKEDSLAAAGFVAQPANTPQRIAVMKSFPPNKFVQQTTNSQIVYVYADPVVCQCVYFGSQKAWGQYRQMVFAQNLANEQQMTAMMAQNAFDFGPWGSPFLY